MSKVIVVIFLLMLVGCAADPVSTSATNNSQVKVDFLFEHDGCRVYRFEDEGRNHYYSVCGDLRSSATDPTHMVGKITVPEETIDNARR